MAVAFNNMPGVLRVPLFYAEVNAGVPNYSGVSRTILLGRKLAAGVLPVMKPTNLGSADPNYAGGRGSMLADQILYARQTNPLGEIWALAIDDPVSGQAATGTITISGTATASGTLVRYVAGERYAVPVAVSDTAATVAAALVAAIGRGYTKFNRRMGAPVTAAAAAGVVTLTARHTGIEGNGIRVEAGLDGDEFEVAGLTVALSGATLSGGTGEVDLAAALATFGRIQFDWITGPYNSVAHLNLTRDFLSDSGAGRWSPTVDLDGHYVTLVDGTVSTLTTMGAARNDRHASILGLRNYPHPLWSIGAALIGWIGFSKNLGRSVTEAIELARPLQTLVLPGIRPPKDPNDAWGGADLASLYNNGISALQVNGDGSIAINRILTTYQTNLFGQADDTFLSLNSVVIAAYLKRYLRLKVTSTYPRHVLRDDNPTGLQGVVTAPQLRDLCIHAYTELCNRAGIVDKPNLFARFLIVERSADASRVNAYLAADMSDEFIAFAANITMFRELNDSNGSLL